MQRSRQFVVFLIAITLFVLGCTGGICASRGLCAYVFGSATTDAVLRQHQFGDPAWWLFLVTAVIGIFVGGFGVLFTIIIPLSAAGRLPGMFDDEPSRQFLIGYAALRRCLACLERAAKRGRV